MYLLDTHILLWAVSEQHKLSTRVRDIIANDDNVIYVSIASFWELQIKKATNKVTFPDNLHEISSAVGYTKMPITEHHILALSQLPLIHRDPFDRMLLAQSLHEGCTLITNDQEILQYNAALIDNSMNSH